MTEEGATPQRKRGSKKAAGAEGAARKKGGGAGAGRKKDAAAAKGAGESKFITPVARMLVRAMWSQEWTAANPEGNGETRKAAWKEAREAAMEKNLKTYRKALNSLTRAGVTLSLNESARKKSEADEDDGED